MKNEIKVLRESSKYLIKARNKLHMDNRRPQRRKQKIIQQYRAKLKCNVTIKKILKAA